MTAARTPAPPSAAVAGGRRKPAPAAEIARLYRLGLTMGEIAGIYRVSAWVIGSRLEEVGVGRRAPGEQTGLPVDRAVRRYRRQPHLLGELAAGLGIHPQFLVDRAVRPASAGRGQGTYRADVRAADVAGLYRAGWTAHGDYAKAAEAAGYSYATFTGLIGEARTAFLALWHEGETPSRLWAADKHGNGGPALRARRILAARRRTRQPPRPPGPAPAQARA